MKCLNEILMQIADIQADRLEPEDLLSIWDFEEGQVQAMDWMLDKVFEEKNESGM